MEKLIFFVTIIAWVFGIIYSILFIGRLIFGFQYHDSLEQKIDRLNGVGKRFPLKVPFIISLICWAWIITMW